jgi:RNA polymerase sigma factor (sigma-70 family)
LSAGRTDNRAGFPPKNRVNYERLLLKHLDEIDQLVRTWGRRRRLSPAEQEDFAGFVRLRLIDDDYAVLRKFQERSTLWTYLSSVIGRLSLDYCAEQWGRWRPSAVADRLGPEAVALERLVTRDGHPLDEAIAIVRAGSPSLAEAQLRAIWAQLPEKAPAVHVGEEAAAAVSGVENSDAGVEDAARQRETARLDHALHDAFAQIAPQDRLLIALRYDQGLSIVEIAKLMQSTVPTLHRRLDKSLKHLRASLQQFTTAEIKNAIGHSSIYLSPMLRRELENFPRPVRLSQRDG